MDPLSEPAPAPAAAPPLPPAMAATPLLGPPFVRGLPGFRPPPAVDPFSHPFLGLLDAGFNSPAPEKAVGDRRINALGPDPCLDFFFQVIPGTPPQRVRDLLAAAWAHDPLTALKLVCNLRDTGKGDVESFYAAALWIHDHHPKTIACNIPALAELGYLKDVPELLCRLIHGADVRKMDGKKKKLTGGKTMKRAALASRALAMYYLRAPHRFLLVRKIARDKHLAIASSVKATAPAAAVSGHKRRRNASPQRAAAVGRKDGKRKKKKDGKKILIKRGALALRALEMYNLDDRYRFLFDNIAQFFADLLLSDIENKNLNQLSKIGLAAKWCPTPDLYFDRSTLLCEGIARRLFPRNSNAEYAVLSEEEYCYRVLQRLHHEVLVPLRQLLQLPEVKRSELPYEHVVSVAMHRYEALLKHHDTKQFESFLSVKVAAEGKADLPHRIASMCNYGEASESELQWHVMMNNLQDEGFTSKFSNCIAVCDVSDSMKGMSMEVCTALSVLISELSEEPWARKVITFSVNPKIRKIKGNTLEQKLNFLQGLKANTDDAVSFKAVYNRILDKAKKLQLPKEKMIKTIFVFSNKEFDDASESLWFKDRQALCRNFQNAGYHNVMPQIVFWNLQGSRALTNTENGVMRLKGFSNSLLKIFLENGGVVHAKNEMCSAISGKEYDKLSLFD